MKLQAVLFDLDNTLILFHELTFYKEYNKALYAYFHDMMSVEEFSKKLMLSTQMMTENDGSRSNLDLFMDAFDKTLYVRDHSFPVMDFRLSSDPERITSSIESAYEAWVKRDQFMETLRGRHIINVDHELNHSNEGTLERRILRWLLDRMEETQWPHYLN